MAGVQCDVCALVRCQMHLSDVNKGYSLFIV